MRDCTRLIRPTTITEGSTFRRLMASMSNSPTPAPESTDWMYSLA